MYAAIVRRIVRNGFQSLNAGDYAPVVRLFHSRVLFSFAGPAPMGGEREGVESAREWFEQLFMTLPGIHFTVKQVLVQGWPWDTQVATRLGITAPRPGGGVYENEGMQFLRLRWGRVLEDRIIEDTAKLAHELQQRQSQGNGAA